MPGAVVPAPYGGKSPQISVNMDQNLMQSRGLSSHRRVECPGSQNVVLPSGTAKIGPDEYDVRTNSAPRTIEELNMLPIKKVNGATVYVRDVATVSSGSHSRPTSRARTATAAC